MPGRGGNEGTGSVDSKAAVDGEDLGGKCEIAYTIHHISIQEERVLICQSAPGHSIIVQSRLLSNKKIGRIKRANLIHIKKS